MAKKVGEGWGGDWGTILKNIVCVDAFIVLSGAVLTCTWSRCYFFGSGVIRHTRPKQIVIFLCNVMFVFYFYRGVIWPGCPYIRGRVWGMGDAPTGRLDRTLQLMWV